MCAYINSGYSLKLEGALSCFFGVDVASEKAHAKEKISAENRRMREQRWIEGLVFDLAEAVEQVNGDGVGNGCWARELAAIGETPAIDLQSIANTSLSFFIVFFFFFFFASDDFGDYSLNLIYVRALFSQ